MRTHFNKLPSLSPHTSAPDGPTNNVALIEIAGTRVIRRREGLITRAEADARRECYARYNRRLYLASLASPTRRRGA